MLELSCGELFSLLIWNVQLVGTSSVAQSGGLLWIGYKIPLQSVHLWVASYMLVGSCADSVNLAHPSRELNRQFVVSPDPSVDASVPEEMPHCSLRSSEFLALRNTPPLLVMRLPSARIPHEYFLSMGSATVDTDRTVQKSVQRQTDSKEFK